MYWTLFKPALSFLYQLIQPIHSLLPSLSPSPFSSLALPPSLSLPSSLLSSLSQPDVLTFIGIAVPFHWQTSFLIVSQLLFGLKFLILLFTHPLFNIYLLLCIEPTLHKALFYVLWWNQLSKLHSVQHEHNLMESCSSMWNGSYSYTCHCWWLCRPQEIVGRNNWGGIGN